MFDANSIGLQVISKEFGKGVITNFGTDERDKFPVRVNFKTGEAYFRADGTCCTSTEPSGWDIKLLATVDNSNEIVKDKVMLSPDQLADMFHNLGNAGKAMFYLRLSTLSLGEG